MLTLRNPLDTITDHHFGYADRRSARAAGRSRRRPPRAPRAAAPPKPVQPEPAAAPAPKIYTVEAIRAAKRSEEMFDEDVESRLNRGPRTVAVGLARC